MDNFFELLNKYPLVFAIIGVLLAVLIISAMIIYIVAFYQGREISFWPPKIGSKQNKTSKRQHDKHLDDTAIGKNVTGLDKKLPEQSTNLGLDLKLKRTDIIIEPKANDDINTLGLTNEDITDFILGEASRHPVLFTSTFSSIPLVFLENIIFISWDGSQASVERILNRSDAYPTSDSWFLCVSLYRQATALPYRTKEHEYVMSESEARRSIYLYDSTAITCTLPTHR